MSIKLRLVLIMLSSIVLLNVMFVPIFDVWGGLFPSDVDHDFFDVIEDFVENGGDAWRHWVVQLTITFFVPAVFMLIMSSVGHRGLFITANAIGIILWLKQIIDYIIEDGFEELIDFEDGNIAIGTWITIILFIISFIVALNSKKQREVVGN